MKPRAATSLLAGPAPVGGKLSGISRTQTKAVGRPTDYSEPTDEYDAAQERGELASRGKPSKAKGLPTAGDAGLTYKQIHEARAVRDIPDKGFPLFSGK